MLPHSLREWCDTSHEVRYCGMTKDQVRACRELKSRWYCCYKSYRGYILADGCVALLSDFGGCPVGVLWPGGGRPFHLTNGGGWTCMGIWPVDDRPCPGWLPVGYRTATIGPPIVRKSRLLAIAPGALHRRHRLTRRLHPCDKVRCELPHQHAQLQQQWDWQPLCDPNRPRT